MQGLTALGYAVKEGHLDIVMALVDRGASLVSDASDAYTTQSLMTESLLYYFWL